MCASLHLNLTTFFPLSSRKGLLAMKRGEGGPATAMDLAVCMDADGLGGACCCCLTVAAVSTSCTSGEMGLVEGVGGVGVVFPSPSLGAALSGRRGEEEGSSELRLTRELSAESRPS